MSELRAETGLFLDGLRCAGCVRNVENALRAVPGVEDASINYTTHRALVRFDPRRTGIDSFTDCVAGLGYAATPYDPAALDRPATQEARAALVRVLVAAFLAGNVMLISLALYIGAYQGIDEDSRRFLRWASVLLSLPAVTWCAWPFWRGALGGLGRATINMDVPIVLGMATAFVTSILGTLSESRHLFADSAAMIVFLILLGRTLERSARARAAGAVERLLALVPKKALRRSADGIESVAATELAPGDRVLVAPGEALPADGRIVRGASELDEALLTGEALPVARREGDAVTGGTRNLVAELEIELTAPASGGTLAAMAALLERAETQRPELQRLADRVAAVFAPAVTALAGMTALAWWWAGAPPLEVALTAAAVLIVACPCALGLATPAAVTAALGRAASLGVLFKSGEAFERCAQVDCAVLDKTGTVTEGRLAVESIVPAAGQAAEAVLRTAAAAEGASVHPLASALRGAAEAAGLELPTLEPRRALPGRGVVAGPPGAQVQVGSRALLDECGVTVSPELEEAGRKLAARGASLAWVAWEANAAGVIALSDPPRPDARAAVSRLRRLGLGVSLVSGDHAEAVTLAAMRAGIDETAAQVTPEGKVEHVARARAQGRRVLVAGDGINDAAALTAADVGVALAQGAGVAVHAADIVIRAPRLGALADAVALSRATLRRIRENLALALGYNALAIPLAVAGVLNPLHAAIAMSLSSLVVTANAVRLLRWQPPT